MGTARMMSAIETMRRRRVDVHSTLQRTREALARASQAMKNADEAIEKTEILVALGPSWRRPRR